MIRTSKGEFRLRRKDGNPFFDPVLEEIVGFRIRAQGRYTETSVIVESWTILVPENSAS